MDKTKKLPGGSGKEKTMAKTCSFNDQQTQIIINSLIDFIVRVAKGNATNEVEIEMLPLVAKELLRLSKF